jgi:predicted dehydrogenase
MKVKQSSLSRRHFMVATGGAIAAFNFIPRHVLGVPGEDAPNDKLNLACVGTSGRGGSSVGNAGNQNVYALCDVDTKRYEGAAKRFPAAKVFQDWRVMLDKEADNIDGVLIATPDHSHAIIAMAAMQLGIHVYVEKPLSRTVSESRALAEAARKYKLCTQLGNQGHASSGARRTNEWIQSGAIGRVKEVHCFSDRPCWPQDCPRPAKADVPANLDWDVWLGPAPEKPYAPNIHPFKWRGYWDYGAGALGDFGAHTMDHPVWAFDLGAPKSVVCTKIDRQTAGSEKETFPRGVSLEYKFGGRGKQKPLTLKWFSGSQKAPRPKELEEGRGMHGNGVVYYGDKYVMRHGSHGGAPRILPESAMETFERPPETMEPSNGGHYGEWFNAIKANDPSVAKSNFDYSGPLSETIALGCVAIRMGEGAKLKWNSKKMTTGDRQADEYVRHEYRKGWKL